MVIGTAAAGLATDFTLTSGFQTVPFVTNIAGGYDDHNPEITAGGFWQNNAHEYRAPVAGDYTFEVRLTPSQDDVDFIGYAYQNTYQWGFFTGFTNPNQEFTITMAAGDTFYCTAMNAGNGSMYLESGTQGVGDNNGSWIKVKSVPFMKYGCTDPIANNYDAVANIDAGTCTYPASDNTGGSHGSNPEVERYPDMNTYTISNKTLQDVVPTEPMIYTGEPLPITLDMRNIVYKRSSLNEILPHDFKSY